MNKCHKYIIILPVLFLSAYIYSQDTPENNELDTFFRKYTESRSKIQVISATFIQKSIYPDETYITTGKLLFVKPRRMVFYTEDPVKYTLIDNTKLYEYEPDIKQIAIYDLKDQAETELFFFAFADDLKELRKKYHVSLISLTGEQGKHGISIRPFIDKEEAQFEEVVLYLRDDDYLPYRIRIVNEDNIQNIIEFEKIEINGKIRLEDTQIFIPSGTNVIENDKQKEIVSGEGKRLPEPATVEAKYIDTSPAPILHKETNEPENKKTPNIVEMEVKDLEPIKK